MNGHGGEAQHVVDHRRLAEQPVVGGQRRLGADLPALALDRVEQRGFLAADIGSGTDADLERERRDERGRAADRFLHGADRKRIFRADIDVAIARAGSVTGDRHAFDQAIGVALHQHAVGEGAAVALVGVADDVLGRTGREQHGVPLDAGREAGAAAAAQARQLDGVDDRLGLHRARRGEPGPAAVRTVVIEAERVGDAAAREGEALLPGEERQRANIAEPVRVAAVQHCGGVGGVDRAIADAARRRLNLDQWLDPDQPAATVADDLGPEPGQRGGDLIGPERDGGHVAGNEYPRHAPTASTMRSIRAASMRATGRPSTSAFGPVGHRPRQ